MATATKATRGEVGTNNWTLPVNALTDDGVLYATAAPAKNASTIGDWDFAAFTDGEIPVGATINSVIIRSNYKVSTTASIASLGVQAGNNGSFDTEESETTEPLTDLNFDVTYNTPPSETDLKTAGRLVARVRGIRGNDNDAVTFSLDYIELRVDYTVATNANAEVAPATATAYNASAEVGPTGGVAAVTATAQQPSAGISPTAGVATATAVAYDATIQTGKAADAELAAATATAYAATTAVDPNAAAASAIAAAYNPSIGISPTAGVAAATATAYNATVQVSGATDVFPDAAAVTATAYDATVQIGGGSGGTPPRLIPYAVTPRLLPTAATPRGRAAHEKPKGSAT